jgi:hypothetical protein
VNQIRYSRELHCVIAKVLLENIKGKFNFIPVK